MRSRWSFLALIAGVLMLIIAIALLLLPPSPSPQLRKGKIVTAKILIARRALAGGQILSADDLTSMSMPLDGRLDDVIEASSSEAALAIGAVAKRPLTKGEVIRKSDIVAQAKTKSLAQRLNPGTRAVIIPLDPVQAHASAISPFDRVDILVSPPQGLDGGAQAPQALVYRNLQVLAVEGKSAGDLEDVAIDPRAGTTGASSITVEVPSNQAIALAHGARSSTLSVLLRRRYDPEAPVTPSTPVKVGTVSPGANGALTQTARSLSPTAANPVGQVLVVRGEP